MFSFECTSYQATLQLKTMNHRPGVGSAAAWGCPGEEGGPRVTVGTPGSLHFGAMEIPVAQELEDLVLEVPVKPLHLDGSE